MPLYGVRWSCHCWFCHPFFRSVDLPPHGNDFATIDFALFIIKVNDGNSKPNYYFITKYNIVILTTHLIQKRNMHKKTAFFANVCSKISFLVNMYYYLSNLMSFCKFTLKKSKIIIYFYNITLWAIALNMLYFNL